MKIIFLGTGTSTGVPEIGCKCAVCTSPDARDKRLRASLYVEYREKRFVIDCGPDFRQQMIRAGIDKIDSLFITHEHYDHTGGMDDLRPFCREYPVKTFLEKRVAQSIKGRFPYCFNEIKYAGVPDIQLWEINASPFMTEGVEIIPIRVMHYRLPILGYRIGNMAYITDMLTIPEAELPKLENLDVLIVNALRRTRHISHQTLDDALALIERLTPKQAYLTHMSHHMGLHAEVSTLLPENVTMAYDGLEVYLPD